MTVLVTGFEPFGGDADNPSAEIVGRLRARPLLATAVLPVRYDRVEAEMAGLVAHHRPGAVLMIGLGETAGVRFELFALNIDDTESADNGGEVRVRRPILDGDPAVAPVAYRSTLPLGELAGVAAESGLAVDWSRDAGGFLCNHVFYVTRHLTRNSDVPCGFVHVGRARPVADLVPFFERAIDRLALEPMAGDRKATDPDV